MKKANDKEINKIILRAEEYRKELSKTTLEDFECIDEIGKIFINNFNSNEENK